MESVFEMVDNIVSIKKIMFTNIFSTSQNIFKGFWYGESPRCIMKPLARMWLGCNFTGIIMDQYLFCLNAFPNDEFQNLPY